MSKPEDTTPPPASPKAQGKHADVLVSDFCIAKELDASQVAALLARGGFGLTATRPRAELEELLPVALNGRV